MAPFPSRCRLVCIAAATALISASWATPARADLDLNLVLNGATPTKANEATPYYLSVIATNFSDGVREGVRLDVTANLATGQCVSNLYLNISTGVTPGPLSYLGGGLPPGAFEPLGSFASNTVNPHGGGNGVGNFDYRIKFDIAPFQERFGGTMTVSLLLNGVTAAQLNNTTSQGVYAGAHVQGIGTNANGSGFVGTTSLVMPEPSGIIMASIGLANMGLLVRFGKRKTTTPETTT